MIGASCADRKILRRHGALHHEEVRCPIAEGNYAAESEDNSGPVHAHRITRESSQRAPEMDIVVAVNSLMNLCTRPDHPPASIIPRIGTASDAQPDEKELKHFIEDRRVQSAERDVNCYRKRGNPNAEVNVPSKNHLHYDGHGIHIDAGHQDRHEGE